MIDEKLGTKRLCPACHRKFYDLGRTPAHCPYCGEEFTPKPILPSKQDQVDAAQQPQQAPAVEAATPTEEAAVEEVMDDVAEVALEEGEDVAVDPDDGAPFLPDDDTPVEEIVPLASDKEDEEN